MQSTCGKAEPLPDISNKQNQNVLSLSSGFFFWIQLLFINFGSFVIMYKICYGSQSQYFYC